MPKQVLGEITDINVKVAQYNSVTETIKKLDKDKKVLATEIKDYAKANGVKDDKGSFYCENEQFIYGATAKKSISLNTEALIAFLKANNLADGVVVTKEVLDEEALDRLIDSGAISADSIEAMTTVKTDYSVSIKKKDVAVEVQEVTLAASKKPTRKLRFKK